jgi:hypothetical protein
LRGLPEPIVLDEWQEAHAFLAWNRARHPSTDDGLTVRETGGDVYRESFLSRIVESGIEGLDTPEHALDVRDYVELALTGIFPEAALRLSTAGRRRWMTSYVRSLSATPWPSKRAEIRDVYAGSSTYWP